MGRIPADINVLKARRLDEQDPTSPFAPAPVEEVIEAIRDQQPDIVFMPHVETAAGIILPDFFFSNRRRHTSWTGDWSSDVCSSDLAPARGVEDVRLRVGERSPDRHGGGATRVE